MNWETKSSYRYRLERISSKMFGPPGPYDFFHGKITKSFVPVIFPRKVFGGTRYWYVILSSLHEPILSLPAFFSLLLCLYPFDVTLPKERRYWIEELETEIYEQPYFYANKAKTEMRHFCLKRYRTRCMPVKRERTKYPRHGQHPERDRNETRICII